MNESYPSVGPATVKKWSRIYQRELYEKVFWLANNFSSKVTPSHARGDMVDARNVTTPIVTCDDLQKGQMPGGRSTGLFKVQGSGDRVRFIWRNRTEGERVGGNTELYGTEEELSFGYLDVPIDQWRRANKIVNPMSTQRNPMLTPDELASDHTERICEFVEEDIWSAVYHGADKNLISLGHITKTQHPNLFHANRPNSDNVPQPNERMSAAVLNSVHLWFMNKQRPITMMRSPKNRDLFGVLVISHDQWVDLCSDTEFQRLQIDARERVADEKSRSMHPLFHGAVAYYKSLAIYPTSRVWNGEEVGFANGTTEHHCAVALGARALFWANGGYANGEMGEDKLGNTRFQFVKDARDDYGNIFNLGVVCCMGITRADFSMDNFDENQGLLDPDEFKNQSSAIFTTAISGQGDFYNQAA